VLEKILPLNTQKEQEEENRIGQTVPDQAGYVLDWVSSRIGNRSPSGAGRAQARSGSDWAHEPGAEVGHGDRTSRIGLSNQARGRSRTPGEVYLIGQAGSDKPAQTSRIGQAIQVDRKSKNREQAIFCKTQTKRSQNH